VSEDSLRVVRLRPVFDVNVRSTVKFPTQFSEFMVV